MTEYYIYFFLMVIALFIIVIIYFKSIQNVALFFNIFVSIIIISNITPSFYDKILKKNNSNDNDYAGEYVPIPVDNFEQDNDYVEKFTNNINIDNEYKTSNIDNQMVNKLRAINNRKHYQKKYRKGGDVETHKKYFGHIFDERNKYNWVAIAEDQLDYF